MPQLAENKRQRPFLFGIFFGGLTGFPSRRFFLLPGGNFRRDGVITHHQSIAPERSRRGPPVSVNNPSTRCLEIVNAW
jgi:hypothetical protein